MSRRRSHAVVLGFLQRPGIDFTQTYASIANIITIRLLLAIAALLKLFLMCMDMDTAFLYGEVSEAERIYIKPLPGMGLAANKVLMLLRSVYGLRNAPRICHQTLKAAFLLFGLTQSSYDPCLFFYIAAGIYCILAVVVDDILVATNSKAYYKRLLAFLLSKFSACEGPGCGLLHSGYTCGLQSGCIDHQAVTTSLYSEHGVPLRP